MKTFEKHIIVNNYETDKVVKAIIDIDYTNKVYNITVPSEFKNRDCARYKAAQNETYKIADKLALTKISENEKDI